MNRDDRVARTAVRGREALTAKPDRLAVGNSSRHGHLDIFPGRQQDALLRSGSSVRERYRK
jgi:hypothetical protein